MTWFLGYVSDNQEAWKVYSDGTASTSTAKTVDARRLPGGYWVHTMVGRIASELICSCSDKMEELYQDYVKRILCESESDAYTSKARQPPR